MNARFHAPTALLADGWAADVRLATVGGRITEIATGVAPTSDDRRLPGPVLPGMPNLHSHAFQRAIAGLAERRAAGRESFWTWREVMYRFVAHLDPSQAEAVAALLYAEMLEQGYTSVVEFHYLHHQPDGRPYADPAEMSLAMVRAARRAGIGLTLCPVFYAHGGFGAAEPNVGQRRFLHDLDGFTRLVARLRVEAAGTDDLRIGIAPHSLRAATTDEIARLLAALDPDDPAMPIHIHVAEQPAEVDACLAWCGRRPVAHLFDRLAVDRRWCLVHATHVDADEIARMAAAQAIVGLCATTEANLGDGVFPMPAFLAAGGRFGVGSDSHITVDPAAELRLAEYGHRLALNDRAVLATDAEPAVGAALYRAALAGGAQATARPVGALAVGRLADFVALDGDHPLIADRSGDDILDGFVFAGDGRMVAETIVGGRVVVADGRHVARSALRRDQRAARARLETSL